MTEDSHEGKIDPFFETVHDGKWNACVGVQESGLNYVSDEQAVRVSTFAIPWASSSSRPIFLLLFAGG